MSPGKWNCSCICSTSFSEQVETLVSTTMKGEDDARTGSSAAMVCAPGGSCGAAVVCRDSTGVALATREPEAEDLGRVAAASEDHEAGPPITVSGEGTGVTEVFLATPLFFFFFHIAAVRGSSGEGATGEAGGETRKRAQTQAEHQTRMM